MKKLLALLTATPLAITACGGSGDKNLKKANIETLDDEAATTQVKEAFKDMLIAATGKVYDSQNGDLISVGDEAVDMAEAGAIEGNWFGDDDSLFSQEDIDALTMGQAYRAAMYFGIDTIAIFINEGAQNGVLVNGMLTEDVAFSAETTPAAYFPAEARDLVTSILETGEHNAAESLATYVTPGSMNNIGVFAQTNLEQIGIDLDLDVMDNSALWTKAAARQHNAFVSSWGTVTGHAGYGLYGPFHSDAHGFGGNIQFLSNDEVDSNLESGQWSTDPTDFYLTAQEEIAKEFSTVPLYSGNRKILVQNVDTVLEDSGIIQRKTHHEFGDVEVSHDDGIFTVASHGDYRVLHPKTANDGFSNLINNHLYETLWIQNSDGLSTNATDFESTLIQEDISLDATDLIELKDGRVTLTLKDDIKWSDGTTMTAAEVIQSVNWTVESPSMSGVTPGVLGAEPHADTNKFTLVFGEATGDTEKGEWFDENGIVDSTKAEVKNFSAWRETIAHTGFMMTKTQFDAEIHNEGTDASKRNIVGSGRYEIEEITTDGHVTLKARTDYTHNPAAKNNGIVIKAILDNTAAVNAFEAGDVDYVTSVPANIWNNQDEKFRKEFTTFGLSYIGFNLDQ